MPRGDVGKNVFAAMVRGRIRPSDLVRLSKEQGQPISYARITNWKTGENDPHTDLLPFLARALNVSMAELLGETHSPEGKGQPMRAIPVKEIDVPKLSPIKAGAEWTDPFDSDETAPIPSFMVDELTFCCKVEGDSMMDFLMPNDIAVFRKDQTPSISNVVVARNNQGELTIKQLKHDGENYFLKPLNPKYPILEASSWRIEGTLTGYIREFGDELQIRHHPRGLRP